MSSKCNRTQKKTQWPKFISTITLLKEIIFTTWEIENHLNDYEVSNPTREHQKSMQKPIEIKIKFYIDAEYDRTRDKANEPLKLLLKDYLHLY